MVVPLILVLSVPPLLWFGHHWTLNQNDTARYLLAGSKLVSGGALVYFALVQVTGAADLKGVARLMRRRSAGS